MHYDVLQLSRSTFMRMLQHAKLSTLSIYHYNVQQLVSNNGIMACLCKMHYSAAVVFSVDYLFLAQQPEEGQDRFILYASRSHVKTHHSRYDSSGVGVGPS